VASIGSFDQQFSNTQLNYSKSVINSVMSTTVRVTSQNSYAVIRVNGSLVTSGSDSQEIPLSVGSNLITVSVTSENGVNSQTFTLTVTRGS
jgi:hypothetical protein